MFYVFGHAEFFAAVFDNRIHKFVFYLEYSDVELLLCQGIPLGEFRKRILLVASQRNMNAITAAKCAGWYRFMQTYVPRCLNREHIGG